NKHKLQKLFSHDSFQPCKVHLRRKPCSGSAEEAVHRGGLVEEAAVLQEKAVLIGPAGVIEAVAGFGGGIGGELRPGHFRPLAIGGVAPLVRIIAFAGSVSGSGNEVLKKGVQVFQIGIGKRSSETRYQLPLPYFGGEKPGGEVGAVVAVGSAFQKQFMPVPGFQGEFPEALPPENSIPNCPVCEI